MLRSWQPTEDGAVGIVEEPDSSECEVKVMATDGVLSYNCEDCFSGEPLLDDDGNKMGQLCVHAAAVAMAAAELNAL